MSNSTSSSTGGIGFCGALFLVLLTLKLLGKITLSWLWVTAPLWGGLALFLTILALVGIVVGGIALTSGIYKRVRRGQIPAKKSVKLRGRN